MNYSKISGFADEIHDDFSIQLESLKNLGLNYIEIRNINGKSITSFSLTDVKRIKQQLDHANIQVSALASPIGKIYITEPFDEHLELFKYTVEIAKILNTSYIRIFSFYIPNKDYEGYKQEVFRRLREMTKIAEEKGIILLHENEKDIYGDSPARCLELIQQMNSANFRCTFDFANFIQCGYKPMDAYKMLKNHIEYIHIKDARFSDKQVVPAGLGDGEIKEIIKDIVKDYHGFFSLEPHLGIFKGLELLELKVNINNSEEYNGFEKFKLALEHFKNIIK